MITKYSVTEHGTSDHVPEFDALSEALDAARLRSEMLGLPMDVVAIEYDVTDRYVEETIRPEDGAKFDALADDLSELPPLGEAYPEPPDMHGWLL